MMNLSPEELLSRKDTLKQFENYIENTTNSLNDIVEQIGWKLSETPTTKDLLVKCPINKEHRVLPSKVDDHCQTCILKQNGYDSTHSFYPSYNCSTPFAQTIKIDKIAQMNILKSAYEESNFTLNVNSEPREVSQSIERYVCDFTPDERKILYDYAVKNTKLSNYNDMKNDLTCMDLFNKTNEKPKTELEILQEQRDLKRRRAAYRGKRVHTDRKSYVEILREVVEGLTNSISVNKDKYVHTNTLTNTTETVANNRIVYKYEGNRNYNGNPYIRWLDIKLEESKLFEYDKKKSDSYYEASTSVVQHSQNKYDINKFRRSSTKSRERRKSNNESKYKTFKRSRSRSKYKERKSRSQSVSIKNKHKQPKRYRTRSKSEESISRKSRSLSVSLENKYKRFKKCRTRSKSKETTFKKSSSRSLSLENDYQKSIRNRNSRSKSIEFSSKIKHSKSPKNYYNSTISNEEDVITQFNSLHSHKKKKKHKSKKKHSKNPKRSHKSKKNSNVEV